MDNDRFVLPSLKASIEELSDDMQVIWTTSDGGQTVSNCLTASTRPKVLLADMSMEGVSGISVCRRIRTRIGKVGILAMTAYSIDKYAEKASLAGALAMVQMVETLAMPSGGALNMIVALVFFVLYLSICVFPVPSSLILSLYFSVACCLTPLHGSGELLCMAYMLGTLVYDTSIRFGLVVAAPVLVGIYVQAWRFPDVSWNLALNSAPVLTFLLLLILNFGQVNRNRSKLMELRLRDERAQDLMHRVKVARMIHDSVTGDLANIARVSQRQMRQCGDPEQHEAWRQTNEQSVRVLDGVHAVIRQLSAETAEKHPGGAHEGPQERLNERVRVWERRLSESGIHGEEDGTWVLYMRMPYAGPDDAEGRTPFRRR